jgi:hypothetical protein
MGQLVAVTEKPTATPGIVRFETNRTLSGSGHERFAAAVDAYGATPSDELARRLFATGQVDAVHVMANIVTVDLLKGHDSSGLADVVANLYQYWHPGMEPPVFEDVVEEAAAEGSATTVGATGDAAGDAELSEAAKRVPMHLLDRSRQARARWAAKSA